MAPIIYGIPPRSLHPRSDIVPKTVPARSQISKSNGLFFALIMPTISVPDRVRFPFKFLSVAPIWHNSTTFP